jgi:hypothetical protein
LAPLRQLASEGVELKFGESYVASDEATMHDLLVSLEDFCKERLHGLELRLALRDGRALSGIIDQVAGGQVTLERADESLIGTFSSTEVVAFELPPEPLPDRSDEVRGF